MFRELAIVLAPLILTSSVFARVGDERGNGGDGLFCNNVVVELLDFYEAKAIGGFVLPHIDARRGHIAVAKELIEPILTFDPARHELYTRWIDSFEREAKFVSDADLIDIDDSKHIVVKSGCSIKQLAVQIEPFFPEDRRYIIDKNSWDSISTVDRAGLLLHEIIYRDAISRGARNSRNVRYLNGLLRAKRIDHIGQAEYDKLMHFLGLSGEYSRNI